jgi:signal transduction histidine kinase
MSDSPLCVLNIDDYLPARYARSQVLRQAGFLVLEAGTGREALRLVLEHKPAVVLLDVNLPDMSGFEVCDRIRGNPVTNATTIIHVSASNVEHAHVVTGLEGGADGYLTEPLDPAVLIATIKAFLRVREAEDALRRSNTQLEMFAYRAAHDLNEPLRAIATHAQMLELQLKGSNPKAEASLNFIISAAARMGTLISELLHYAHVSHVGLESQAIDCESVLARVLSNLDAAIRESGARTTHDPLPVVMADPRIEEVFQNLISNAIKYRRNDVTPEIHISARLAGDWWTFCVRDNGIGIGPEYIGTIFTVFTRLHGQKIPGTGLGLALSKSVIEAHSGKIWAESEVGKGSAFYFTLRSLTNASGIATPRAIN